MSEVSALKARYGSVCAILLQKQYNAWRREMEEQQERQPACTGFLWDCAFKEARDSLAEYIGAAEGISIEVMLHLEMRYEEEMTGDQS